MNTRTSLICSAIVVLLATVGCLLAPTATAGAAGEKDAGTVRVGVFDSRGVALAWGRSAQPGCLLAKVAEIREAYDRAETAGDEDRMKELEAKAEALQEHIHKQVFSGAPIDDILAMVKDDMPNVATAANVKLIATGVLHHGENIELVDITQELCAIFEPDAETRKMISEIMAQPVVDESELDHDH